MAEVFSNWAQIIRVEKHNNAQIIYETQQKQEYTQEYYTARKYRET